MKLFVAFLKLIRYPNLFFIALTQFLFYYCIILPEYARHPELTHEFDWLHLVLLIAASILIAAAGYIINDYFDLNIDRVNRPERLIIEKLIKRRWAIVWHLALSVTGIVISFYLGWKIGNLLIGIINIVCVLMLWFYSTTFKRQLLIGNIIISLLTAWVVLVLYVAEMKFLPGRYDKEHISLITKIYKYAVMYGGFAFIISLIREVIKDMEDMEGDEKYNCKTMPIIWGIPASKVFVAVWLIVLIGALLVLELYSIQLTWWWPVLYNLLLIILPLFHILRKLFKAFTTEDFHNLSNLVKLVMLTGILSMLFFKWYLI